MAECGSSSSSITKQGRVAGLCCGIAWPDENQPEEAGEECCDTGEMSTALQEWPRDETRRENWVHPTFRYKEQIEKSSFEKIWGML